MKRKIVFGWFQIVVGLFIFSFGVHLTIFANIGLAPWDCLGMGISYHTPLNYGISMTLIALCVLGVDLLLKEKIGFGTIIDALLTGNFVQFFNNVNPFPLTYAQGSDWNCRGNPLGSCAGNRMATGRTGRNWNSDQYLWGRAYDAACVYGDTF